MNLEEDYQSDSDSDDEDFNPLGAEDSGEESIDEKYEGNEYEDADEEKSKDKTKKRKKVKSKGRSTRKTESPPKEIIKSEIIADPEAEKKRIDNLFAEFLAGTEIPPTSTTTTSSSTTTVKTTITETKKATDIPKVQQIFSQTKESSPPKIFEFAGETVEISNSQSISNPSPAVIKSNNPQPIKRPAKSGLTSVLNQLGKKSKLSVLEKTKLDWDGFKSKEGISEELKTHNRGRDGFLERRDFLERTDLRQFEIEKNMRSASRRNK
ncbi:hypothetical protein PVAND_009023 [Polypedilum vanderplanki]|uniref:Craniofacial development protein 1 n=1 Tax=Polypedilum vanderplanki TaxID=319348 RepID=A0A9J6CBM3_POLVA|nr:hypothetical protein PVAND_009023 [Polypedilum vanderplanki]